MATHGTANHAPTLTTTTAGGTDAQLAAKFPSYGWAMAIPELANLIRQADTLGWTPAELASHIQTTSWYTQHSDSARQYDQLWATDPASASANQDKAFNAIVTQASRLGVTLDYGTALSLTQQSLRYGWSAQQVTDGISAHLQYQNNMAGQAGLTQQTLKQMAQDYLIPVGDATLRQWTLDVLSGKQQIDSFKTFLSQQASTLFPALAPMIAKGSTVKDLVDPYKQLASSTLEMNSATIDWTDPKWRRAIDTIDDKGQHSLMSLADWKSELMRAPEYGYQHTEQARTQAADFNQRIASEFGVLA